MMTIDFVNGRDLFDGTLWFFDGKYVGHDDQIGEFDFAPNGTQRELLFRHRVFKDDVTFDAVEPLLGARTLNEIEHLLKEIS